MGTALFNGTSEIISFGFAASLLKTPPPLSVCSLFFFITHRVLLLDRLLPSLPPVGGIWFLGSLSLAEKVSVCMHACV